MIRSLLPLAASTFILAACTGEAIDTVEPIRTARIETVQSADGPSRREFVGRVEARLTVDLAFQVGGRLADFPVSEGELIPEGQTVAQLEAQDFDRAVREARVQLQQASQTLERTRTLFDRGIAAEAALEDAQTAYDLRAVALENARQNLSYTTVTAPFQGLVSRRLVDNFTTVAPGQPILRLQDMSELRVAIAVPESLIATIDQNGARDLRARFAFLPDQSFELEYRELIAEPDQASQTYRVLLALPADLPGNILPGMTANVSVTLDAPRSDSPAGVDAPVSALTTGENGRFQVWVYDPATSLVQARDVITGPVAGQTVRIQSGLTAGEQIVTAGVNALYEGMQVRPLASRTQSADSAL